MDASPPPSPSPSPSGAIAADPAVGEALRYLRTALTRTLTLPGADHDADHGPVQDRTHLALAETEHLFGNARWFWTEDNAKALELLAQPPIWNADPGFAEAILDFVLAMSPGPLIFRRAAEPQLQVLEADPKAFRVVNAFCRFTGDLSRGLVHQGHRSNDGDDRIAARHTGNLVEFRHRGRAHCLDVEDRIAGYGITRLPGAVVLHHESLLRVPHGLLRRQRQVATLRYEYRIADDSAVLGLRVSLRTEPGVTLSRVRLTTALDALSGDGHGEDGRAAFRSCVVDGTDGWRTVPAPDQGADTLHLGSARHLSFPGEAAAGPASGIHIRPDAPDRLLSVKATARPGGRLHWVTNRYAQDLLAPGQEFTIGESRLLTLGNRQGEAADYAALLAEPHRLRGIDPSGGRDRGSILNAVATICLNASLGHYLPALPPSRLAALRAWYDRHLEAWFAQAVPTADGPARPFIRGLAFLILSLETMCRTPDGGRYEAPLAAALDLLLAQQQTGPNEGAFVDAEPAGAWLDCHAAALLALTRVAGRLTDSRIDLALARALSAVRLGTIDVSVGDRVVQHDAPAVRARVPEGKWADGKWVEDGGFWTYKLGLLLRALRAVLAAVSEGRIVLGAEQRQRALQLALYCRHLLGAVMRNRPAGLEFLTSPYAGEANCETQAWAILGLLAPEDESGSAGLPPDGTAGWAPHAAAVPGAAGASPTRRPDANTPARSGDIDLLHANVKVLASDLARTRYAAGHAGPNAPVPKRPVAIGVSSRLCCQADIEHDWLRHWCGELRMAPLYHRKVWEDCFVLQALWESGMLLPGRRALGFGVGREWLPAYFAGRGIAGRGIEVVATDLDRADARAQGWIGSRQHADATDALFRPDLVPEAAFRRLVTHRAVDMAAIPADLTTGRFDFLWSICSLEHLGTLEAGEAFVLEAMRCLRPGGIAVHTTEYNFDAAGPTMGVGPTVLYQRRHLDRLAASLAEAGHAMLPLPEAGEAGVLDRLVDLPPFGRHDGTAPPHLRLALDGYTVSAAGLIVRAGPAA